MTDADIESGARRALGDSIDQARKRLGWTLEELAAKAGYDERTIRNVIKGDSTRIKTVHNICTAAGINYNEAVSHETTLISSEEYGGYTFNHYDDYVGTFFAYRRSFTFSKNILRSFYVIEWSEKKKCLTFSETQAYTSQNLKKTVNFSQKGEIFISNNVGLLHLMTRHEGAVRLITLTKMRFDDLTMHGVVLTQSQRSFYYQPSISPIFFQKAAEEPPENLAAMVGPIVPGHEEYDSLNETLAEVERNIGIFALNPDR